MLTNLVQERTVADAQQFGSSLSIPASLSEGIIDGVNFRFVAVAAKRQVKYWLWTCGRYNLSAAWLPRIGARGIPISAVLTFGFGVTHILTPQSVNFDKYCPEDIRHVRSEKHACLLSNWNFGFKSVRSGIHRCRPTTNDGWAQPR